MVSFLNRQLCNGSVNAIAGMFWRPYEPLGLWENKVCHWKLLLGSNCWKLSSRVSKQCQSPWLEAHLYHSNSFMTASLLGFELESQMLGVMVDTGRRSRGISDTIWVIMLGKNHKSEQKKKTLGETDALALGSDVAQLHYLVMPVRIFFKSGWWTWWGPWLFHFPKPSPNQLYRRFHSFVFSSIFCMSTSDTSLLHKHEQQ